EDAARAGKAVLGVHLDERLPHGGRAVRDDLAPPHEIGVVGDENLGQHRGGAVVLDVQIALMVGNIVHAAHRELGANAVDELAAASVYDGFSAARKAEVRRLLAAAYRSARRQTLVSGR